MNEQTTSGDHGRGWTPSSVRHMLGAAREFWSSDLNNAVVRLVIAVEPAIPVRRALWIRRLWQRARAVIDVRQGAAESLAVRTESVDSAYSVNATHHFDNLRLAISEFVRVLTPGGRLLVVDEDFTNDQHPYHHRDSFHAPDPVDANHIVSLLTDAGLSATHTDHQAIGGLTATVIEATAPHQTPPPEPNVNQEHPGEAS